jgi:ubiquitin-like 1-activating enzyme E1 B
VLRAKVAVNTPNLSTVGGFDYVEGEGLDEDDVERCQALLPRVLAQLPGGGLVHGTILEVQDQSQALDFEVIISHQVSHGWAGMSHRVG